MAAPTATITEFSSACVQTGSETKNSPKRASVGSRGGKNMLRPPFSAAPQTTAMGSASSTAQSAM